MADGSDDKSDTTHPPLDPQEAAAVEGARSLSAISVYSVIHAEGIEEMERSMTSLWWSGIAAGLGISASVLAEGILRSVFDGHPYRAAIENLGYTVGFIIVILGRMQLFTENTITPILPLLRNMTPQMFGGMARLWAVVFAANMVGCYATAAFTYYAHPTSDAAIRGMMEVARHYTAFTPAEGLLRGIPAGFFIAGLVWMLPSSRGFEILTIFVMTYLIGMADLTHVVAGSVETALVFFDGGIGAAEAVRLTAATLAGNVIGGSVLFAFLAYGQVASELEEREKAGRLKTLGRNFRRRSRTR